MQFNSINFSESDNYSIIRLNRPDKFNSVNNEMAAELQEVLKYTSKSEKTRCIYITGEGKAFCAGQDLSEAAPNGEPTKEIAKIVRENYNPIIKLLRETEKPIVCGVNGIAAGAGANIALSCDIVVAKRDAYFMQAFSNIGLIPDSGGTYFLPRLIGWQRAAALMFLGEKVSADEAEKIGMIYRSVPVEEFFDYTLDLVIKLANRPTIGLGLTKRALNYSMFSNLNEQLRREEELQELAGSSEDYYEGVKAFLEKRKPNFTGK